MAKSFKRAIACLLAVLMIVFSMPFTALAAAGDYEPDVELLFFPVKTNDWFDYSAVKGGESSSPSVPNVNPTSGLYDVALDYDKENGTLSLSAAKARPYIEYLAEGDEEFIADYYGEDGLFADGDVELVEGDFFAVTVVLDNVQTLQTLGAAISFSNNITPAATYSSKVLGSAKKKYYEVYLGTEAEAKASGRYITGPVISDYSAELYSTDDIGVTTEDNEIDKFGNIYLNPVSDEPCADVSRLYDAEYINPKTGEMGYTYENRAIIGTFIFKIVGEGPITFSYAGDNLENYQKNLGGYYVASSLDGTGNENWTTADDNVDAPGSAGERKMTFFAAKEEEPDDTYYTVTYTGDDIETTTEQVIENGSPASIPALPTSTDAHISYAWDTNPSGAVITGDTTFTVVKTTADHNWSDWTESEAAVAATCTTAGKTAVETRTCSVGGEVETKGGDVVAALGHDYVAAVTAPTCTEQGYTTYTCSRCGDSYTDNYVDALGHNWGEWTETDEEVPSTCVTPGTSAGEKRECSRCDAVETRGGEALPLDPNNHENVVTDAAVAATCTATGLTEGSHCAACNTVIVAQTITPALGHDWGEWTVTTTPTCTEVGEETRECSRCDATETREVVALGHDYVPAVTAPTCTERGYTTYTCSRCGDSYKDNYVDALGHTPAAAVKENEVAATCEEDGSYDEVVYCSVCRAELSRETKTVTALDHDWDEGTITTAATCTEDGVKTFTCQNDASHTKTEVIAATGHDWGAWTTVTEATEDNDGLERRVCANDASHVEERVIPALAHTHVVRYVEAKPATCLEAGNDEYYICDKCGKIFVDEDAYYEVDLEAVTIGALGHDYKAVVTAPTCTEQGYTTYTCSRCGDSYVADYVDALEHDWDEGTITTAATCTEDGVKTYTCKNDASHTKTEVIAATGHTPGEAKEEDRVEATCEEDGSYNLVVRCTVCDAIISSETKTIPATGHAWGEWEVVTPATREAAGLEQRVCANDASHVEKREIPALEGVLITVPKSELGTVEIKNGAAYDDGDETTDAALYTYGKEYKLVATPADDATFVGWTINGRLVSEAPTYSNVAYTDLTVTPVFAEKDKENEYTIVFFNKYGNVIATYNNEVAIPTVPQLQGYDFAGWTINGEDVTEEDVLALTESAQVWAKYEKNGAGAYTITADGAEISLPSGVENGAIPFDTKATVTFEGAAAIAAVAEDGTETVVAYGDTYTFYVGADVTLKAVAEAEEDVVVTILGHDLVAGTSNKYNIVATRAVPDGWKVKDRGFVYGQASAVPATSAEIDLDNLPAGVKATHGTPTASEQFSLAIKVGAGKTARFYAFITVQKGNETKVVFSDAYEIKA